MSKKTEKDEGPMCGCGRPDLYEEWLKQNKDKNDKDADSTGSCELGGDKSIADKEGEKD